MTGVKQPERSHVPTAPALHPVLCGPRQGEETRKEPSVQAGRGPWKELLCSVPGLCTTSRH